MICPHDSHRTPRLVSVFKEGIGASLAVAHRNVHLGELRGIHFFRPGWETAWCSSLFIYYKVGFY